LHQVDTSPYLYIYDARSHLHQISLSNLLLILNNVTKGSIGKKINYYQH